MILQKKILSMKKISKFIFGEVIPLVFVCLMLYTAISKLKDYNLSREQMAMMPLLTPVAHIVVWSLPLAEIVIAALLFIPVTRLKGLYAFTTLMVFFAGYVSYMMIFYDHLPCSCGGFLEMLSWKGHLIFNSIVVLLGIAAIALIKRIDSSPHEDVRRKVLTQN